MITKVIAAKRAASSGAHTGIASGREPMCCCRLAAGEAVGTLLVSRTPRWPRASNGWPITCNWPAGDARRRCGQGAERRQEPAADRRGRGQGEFERGAACGLRSPGPRNRARPDQLRQRRSRLIARKSSQEIESILGFHHGTANPAETRFTQNSRRKKTGAEAPVFTFRSDGSRIRRRG
jgi:glutamate 5-kinase